MIVNVNELAAALRLAGFEPTVSHEHPVSVQITDPAIVVFEDGEVQLGITRILPGAVDAWMVLGIIRGHLLLPGGTEHS